MHAQHFDSLVRRLGDTASRRRALEVLGGGVMAALFARVGVEEAGAAGCRNAGHGCKRRRQCCSGICRGKSGHKRCRQAPGQGTCTIQLDSCFSTGAVGCNGDANCACFVTKAGASFCGEHFIRCTDCATNADCVAAGHPAGSVCVPAKGGCAPCNNTPRGACIAPCPTP